MIQDLKLFSGKSFPGGKVILRPLERSDLEKSLEWLTDPLVNKYLSQNFKDLTVKQEEQWFDYIQDSHQDIVFAILEKSSGKHIGNCALHKIDQRKKTCELGIVIGDKDFWDRGFGTDAVKVLVDFALDDLEMSKIWLNVYTYNHRAIKVYENVGFKLVRVLKRNHLYNGKYWDTLIMEYS
jgi:RimJ/RimL family protein N-acetyltransferase